MAQDDDFPELVMQRAHHPGHMEPVTFEEALRNLVRNSPYLGISIVLHAVVFFVLWSMKVDIVPDEQAQKIVASAEEIEEPIPPEPPPEEKLEEIDEIIDDPVITEDVVEVTEVVDTNNVDAAFDATGLNDVIGVGGGAGGSFGGKLGRRGQTGKRAGTPYLKAVDDALRWLKHHQNPDGYWSCADFRDECGKQGNDTECFGSGNPVHDIGVTGLSLLAFMGAGHTPSEGKYQDVVKAGIKYLTDVQDRDGNFANPEVSMHTYDHIIASLAVIEAYALTKKFNLKKSSKQALDYMYSLRNPGAAWRYADTASAEMIDHPNDTSVTGWAILAMTLARDYGIDIDETALEDALTFIEEMTDSSGRTGYFERGGGVSRVAGTELTWPQSQSEAMTAVGVLCRIFVDPDMERPGNEDMIDRKSVV